MKTLCLLGYGCEGNTRTNLSPFVLCCLFTDKQRAALLPRGWFVLTSNGDSNIYGRGNDAKGISSFNTSRYVSINDHTLNKYDVFL